MAAFLHHDRLAEHLQGAGLAQRLGQEGQIFRCGVIDLGLLLHHLLLDHLLLLCRGPLRDAWGQRNGLGQDQPQQVGAIQAARAQAHANPLRHVGGVMAKARCPAGR